MASTALPEDVSWEYAGRIGVDTGMVIVGDPRYFATADADEPPAKDWKAFLGLLRRKQHRGIAQLHYRQGHAGLGVVVGGVGGDHSLRKSAMTANELTPDLTAFIEAQTSVFLARQEPINGL
jgi:hypothetical protein